MNQEQEEAKEAFLAMAFLKGAKQGMAWIFAHLPQKPVHHGDQHISKHLNQCLKSPRELEVGGGSNEF